MPILEKRGRSRDLGRRAVKEIEAIAGRLERYGEADRSDREETVTELLTQLEQVETAEPTSESRPQAPTQPPLRKPGTGPDDDAPPAKESRSPAPVAEPPPSPAERSASGLDAPVTVLPGISAAYAARLKRLDIATVGDLLYHFPHRYEDYRTLKPINRLEYGEETTIIGTIWETSTRKTRGGGTIVTSIIADASGTIEAVWFNQPYLARQLRAGRQIVLSGKVDEYLGRLTCSLRLGAPGKGADPHRPAGTHLSADPGHHSPLDAAADEAGRGSLGAAPGRSSARAIRERLD